MADTGPFFHVTKADPSLGDELTPGLPSNFGSGKVANVGYFTATLDAAVWGAELAHGHGPVDICEVVPIGAFDDAPNHTD